MTAAQPCEPAPTDNAPAQAAIWATKLASGAGPTSMHMDLARRVLHRSGELDAARPFQEQALAREVWVQMRRFVSHVWLGHGPAQQDGMLYADARAAEFFDGLGAEGVKFGEVLREKARGRWAAAQAAGKGIESPELWKAWIGLDDKAWILPVAHIVATCMWRDHVKLRLVQLCYPAISMAVVDTAMRSLWSGKTATLTGHRLFRWAVHRAFAQQACSCAEREIRVDGGYAGLAAQIGMHSTRDGVFVHRALDAMASARARVLRFADEPWLSLAALPSAPGRPASLNVLVGDVLRPYFVNTLPKRTASQRVARTLVPVPETLPPLVGRTNEHAAQCALQLLLLAEFRMLAKELAEEGYIAITETRWRQLAYNAGVPVTLVPRIIDCWLEAKDGMTSVLQRHGTHSYSLADVYGPALNFILRGAQREREGRLAQRAACRRSKSAAKRAIAPTG